MNLDEIKEAVASGKKVCWKTQAYQIKDWSNGLFIVFTQTDSAIGLTHADGVTLNGAQEDFFIVEGA